MTQHPNHNPQNPCTFALQEMSLGQLKEFFALCSHNISRLNKSSEICHSQWGLSIVFYCALEHRILPLFDNPEENECK